MIITIDDFLRSLIKRRKGAATYAVATTLTRPRLYVKHRTTAVPCPFPQGVEKLAERSVCFGAIYPNSVNRQREKESEGKDWETFVPARLWQSKEYPDGAAEHDGPYTVRHRGTGRRYFAVRPCTDRDNQPIILRDRWVDLATHREIDPSECEGYLPQEREGAIVQGLEQPVPWRVIAFDSFVQIRTFGNIFDFIRG